jgi:SAM-dependent methyltransferase
MTNHDETILDQFTLQAAPFADRHRHDDELLNLIVEMSGVGAGDLVLDVACGPGIVACALATRAKVVTGIDFAEAMLRQAEKLQRERGLINLKWQRGSATELPFAASSFDCVTCRFAFHHFVEPGKALREMARVCRPGGTILIADVAPTSATRAAYDALEKQRDPSHTMALLDEEFEKLGREEGLELERKTRYDLAADVEGLLASSFPPLGGAPTFRQRVNDDLSRGQDQLGIRPHLREGIVWFFFPILIMTWKKP